MKVQRAIAAGCMAAVLVGCGNAKPIDYTGREAEDQRREDVRSADVANAREERDAADEAYARGRATASTASHNRDDIAGPGT